MTPIETELFTDIVERMSARKCNWNVPIVSIRRSVYCALPHSASTRGFPRSTGFSGGGGSGARPVKAHTHVCCHTICNAQIGDTPACAKNVVRPVGRLPGFDDDIDSNDAVT